MSRVHDLPVGSILIKIRRAVFVRGANISGDTGDLELLFDNGQTFSFGVAGDGESLAIESNPWSEQFPEPVTPENQAFLRVSGKWELIDAGALLWSYRELLGRRLSAAETLGGSGLRLDFDGMPVKIEVIADELHVTFES